MPKVPPPAAAIDLGSNSFRLLIGLRNGRELVSLASQRLTVRLAQGLGESGIIVPEKLTAALAAIASFRREIDRFAIDKVCCCGTETLRRAANCRALLTPAERLLGAPIKILTGREEAELSGLGVENALADRLSFPCLIADVGGGSSELIFRHSPSAPAVIVSLPVGAVILAGLEPAPRRAALRSFAGRIKDLLQEVSQVRIKTLVGTGGTASSLAMLAQRLTVYEAARINGFFLSSHDIDEIHRAVSALPANQRKMLAGMEAGREDIITSGLEIYQEILATINAPGMIVSDAGLLEGILLSITGAYPA